ncbi:MAG TPA: alpha/beta hydrolase [Roseiflexaceae bacterium]|nr:alpha/beta hydrolase [Roseiflexaceae bacterium]
MMSTSALQSLKRNNVTVTGKGQQPLVFSHGFGCDQHMWRFVAPAFEDAYKVICFDHVGAGQSDLAAYDPAKYSTLDGYTEDVLEICQALDVQGGVFVGHSVSAMIGILAAIKAPEHFDKLVLVGPSPCYISDEGYQGGFSRAEIDALLEFLDSNYLGWSSAMAPAIMGNADRPELAKELTNSFCRTDPLIAKQFAQVTFLSDNRSDLPQVRQECLILQCSEDVIAPIAVGHYLHQTLPASQLVVLKATGHCPNLSAPDETTAAIQAFLAKREE